MSKMSEKQSNYIIYLANRLEGTDHKYLSQIKNTSIGYIDPKMSKAQASNIIDRLWQELGEK